MARKIVITSGKGGVGKTTVTANLGVALATLGFRVVLVDIDFGLNNLDVVMGVENRVVYDVKDVLEGRCRIRQALVQDVNRKNLFILPSDKLSASSQISGQNLKLMVEGLAQSFDYVLLDCPAGIDVGFHRAIASADQAIVVTTPTLTSLRDADKVISILKSYKMDRVSVLINRARGDLMMGEKMMMPTDVSSLLRTELIGVLPEEDAVFLYGGYASFPKKSESKKAYKILAHNVVKGGNKIYDVTNKYSGFFGSIRRGIKGSI